MSYTTIVTAIAALLQAAAGTSRVYTYERQVTDPAKFIELFKGSDGKIHGWEIARRSCAEWYAGAVFRQHQFMLQGYAGLQDAQASNLVFQERCDAICAAFRTAADGPTWEYRNAADPDRTPAQIETINDRMFGAVLCHCAEISLTITERIIT